LLTILVGLLVWSYQSPLEKMWAAWHTPTYALGWLVPMMAALVLATRWRMLQTSSHAPRRSGLVLLCLGLLARLYCADLGLEIAEMMTILPCLAGLALMVGGWRMLRWCGPAIVLLLFMFPLSWSLENSLLDPLAARATRASVFFLQTLGLHAHNEGQVIFLTHSSNGMVDPCSRLRMATLVVAIAVAILMIFRRPRWEWWVIFLSAIPIAIAANVVRITIGGVAFSRNNTVLVERMLGDWGAWVTAAAALTLLAVESLLLAWMWREGTVEKSSHSRRHAPQMEAKR
jgi:exosortase